MSDIIQELERECSNLEIQFQASLERTANLALAREYSDIITIRQSIEVLRRRQTKVLVAQPAQQVRQPRVSKPIRATRKTNGFVMTQAVEAITKTFGKGERFTIKEVWEKLKQQYPNQALDSDKKRSASATLSNLTAKGEIVRIEKGIGGEPTIYEIRAESF